MEKVIFHKVHVITAKFHQENIKAVKLCTFTQCVVPKCVILHTLRNLRPSGVFSVVHVGPNKVVFDASNDDDDPPTDMFPRTTFQMFRLHYLTHSVQFTMF